MKVWSKGHAEVFFLFSFSLFLLCVQYLPSNHNQRAVLRNLSCCTVKFSSKCSSHLQSDAEARISFESHENSGNQWRHAPREWTPGSWAPHGITVAPVPKAVWHEWRKFFGAIMKFSILLIMVKTSLKVCKSQNKVTKKCGLMK